jgi:excisionase family DNA binding protein
MILQEEDAKKWIKEAIREELKDFLTTFKAEPAAIDEPLITRKEIAAYLKVSLVTLNSWKKKGLPFHMPEGSVRFLKSEVLEWVKAYKERFNS